jgi:hypothetical protein
MFILSITIDATEDDGIVYFGPYPTEAEAKDRAGKEAPTLYIGADNEPLEPMEWERCRSDGYHMAYWNDILFLIAPITN